MTQLPALLTTEEVATAMRVSTATVLEWVKAGTLTRAPTPGRAFRFYRADIEALIGEPETGPLAVGA